MDRFSAYRLHSARARPTNPVLRVVYSLVGLGLMGVALVLGTVFFVAFAGIALVGGSLLALRIWWVSRKTRRAMNAAFTEASQADTGTNQASRDQRSGDVIEGEYQVVDSDRD